MKFVVALAVGFLYMSFGAASSRVTWSLSYQLSSHYLHTYERHIAFLFIIVLDSVFRVGLFEVRGFATTMA